MTLDKLIKLIETSNIRLVQNTMYSVAIVPPKSSRRHKVVNVSNDICDWDSIIEYTKTSEEVLLNVNSLNIAKVLRSTIDDGVDIRYVMNSDMYTERLHLRSLTHRVLAAVEEDSLTLSHDGMEFNTLDAKRLSQDLRSSGEKYRTLLMYEANKNISNNPQKLKELLIKQGLQDSLAVVTTMEKRAHLFLIMKDAPNPNIYNHNFFKICGIKLMWGKYTVNTNPDMFVNSMKVLEVLSPNVFRKEGLNVPCLT